jgi:hypothetical protein
MMTRNEMIAAIAQDAYEGATERELRQIFIEHMLTLLDSSTEAEIAEAYAEIEGDA